MLQVHEVFIQEPAVPVSCFQHAAHRGARQAKRFFTDDMFALLKATNAPFLMEVIGERDVDQIDVRGGGKLTICHDVSLQSEGGCVLLSACHCRTTCLTAL